MPKMKSNSGAKKRLKVTGTGALKRQKAFRSHILTKKSRKTKRQLKKDVMLEPMDQRRMKRLLCM